MKAVPSKVFILGEYLALKGGPALIATLSPCFELKAAKTNEEFWVPDPQSPAGQCLALNLKDFLSKQSENLKKFTFFDPWKGQGGFGRSTAEFILALKAFLGLAPHTLELWKIYRSITKGSGLDLVAQNESLLKNLNDPKFLGTSVGVYGFNKSLMGQEELNYQILKSKDQNHFPNHFKSQILIFSATHQERRKTKTHEHLKKINLDEFLMTHTAFFDGLKKIVLRAKQAWECAEGRGDVWEFASCVRESAQLLSSYGFEHELAKSDRIYFESLPGVLAAKGCGADLTDAFLVILSSGEHSLRNRVIEEALQRNLVFVGDLS